MTGETWGLGEREAAATSPVQATGEIVVLLLKERTKQDEVYRRR